MLSSSEFNNAVPQFTNGNYANNPIDPSFVEEPSMSDYNRGVEPLETLPAQWWNWLCNQFTSRFNKLNLYVKNIFDELTQLFSLVNVTPDGTEGSVTTGQLKNIFKELYPTYVSDKLELGTTYVPQTREVNGHALTENVTVTKSDVGLGNVENTGDSAIPKSGGTTKFTTGGAYTELNKKVDKTSITSEVTSGDNNPVTSNGVYNNRYAPKGYANLDTVGWYKIAEFGKRNQGQSIIIDLCRGYSINPCESHHIVVSYGWQNVNVFDLANASIKLLTNIKLCWNSNNNDKLAVYVYYDSSNNNTCYFSISGMAVDSVNAYISNLETFNFSTDSLTWENSKTISLGENGFYINGKNRTPDAPTTDGNYLLKSAVSDGTPSFSWQGLSDIVENNNMNPVTSNAVSKVVAVPSDAVLHYSFDDVPDYPDGTAIYYRNKDFTTSDGWGGGSNVITAPNGILTLASVATNYIYKNVVSGNIIKSIVTSSVDATVMLYASVDETTKNLMSRSVKANVPTEFIGVIPSGTLASVGFYGLPIGSKFEITSFYIGDGSYSTPIIDNANGQNNAVNNGGIATKGVSGKGAYFLQGKRAVISRYNLNRNFSVSVWVNPDNNTQGLNGDLLVKLGQFILRNGASWRNTLMLSLYGDNETLLDTVDIDNLLSPSNWTHIVVTRNELSCKVYINGEQRSQHALANNTIGQNNNHMYVGNSVTTRPQSIDDLLVFDRALTETEVMALYLNKANTPKFYDINNYNIDNATPVPAQNSNNLFTAGGAYDFFGGNTNANAWLGRVFSWALGKNWTQGTGGADYSFYTVYCADNIWVAGSTHGLWWSTDGKNWTQGTGGTGYTFMTVYYANNIWVAGSASNGLWWSTDGKNWTQGTGSMTGYVFNSVYYANGIWVASSVDYGLWWSTDGKAWTQGTGAVTGIGYTFYAVYYANGIWGVTSQHLGIWYSDFTNADIQ